jgi:hypothetical protein
VSKQQRTGWIVFVVSFLFWFAETAYFGWHMEPLSYAELWCDLYAACGVWFGIGRLTAYPIRLTNRSV